MPVRPRVGISSCLLGERVRYDGGHKRSAWIVDELGRDCEWVAVCPEVEAGFGTPREPMDLVRRTDGAVALVTKDTRRDVTAQLVDFARARVDALAAERLCGYVFKADSPSCDPNEGLFARALASRFPDLPIEDERALTDPERRRQFVERVSAYDRRRVHDPAASFEIVRVRGASRSTATDLAASEEPLEIRLHRRAFAVLMRTPGADRELAAGFLLAERVIRSADDLGVIEFCRDAHAQNVVDVTLTDASRLDRVFDGRRQVTMNSSCGLCGRVTIESLATDATPVVSRLTLTAAAIAALPARLRESQSVFDETGGLHAAGLFTADGRLADFAEDVGRHNAVDKVVGRMVMRDALPLPDFALCVSGRTSYEIIQKAILAGIPIVAAVSAPSSLAIELARAFDVTLVGFVRGDAFNIYTNPSRIL